MRDCKTCRFWGASHDFNRGNSLSYPCKRHSPTVRITTDQYSATQPVFPNTYGSDFCGDWEEFHEEHL